MPGHTHQKQAKIRNCCKYLQFQNSPWVGCRVVLRSEHPSLTMPSGTGDSYDSGGGGGLELETPPTILATYEVQEVESDLSVQYSASRPSKVSVAGDADGYASGYDTDFANEEEEIVAKYPELCNLFHVHNTIGHGGFSKVKVATDLHTGNKVAIKIVDKEHVGSELPRIDLEVETLQPLKHPHICKLYSVICAQTKIFMIMEFCPTDLYEHIVTQDERLPPEEARRIFIQLMSAVAYLHSNGIVHRDLKPENVLLDRNFDVKLTDFGLCAVPGKSRINKPTLKTLCGSPAYCAPELLRGPPYVGSKVDVWSLGIMLYVLLAKELPFYSKNVKELYKKIQEGTYKIPEWMSEPAVDLIGQMLQPIVSLRPSLHRLWSHPWIEEGELSNFKTQMGESLLQVEMESRIQSRYSFLPMPIGNCGRRFSENFSDEGVGGPVFRHNYIVPYVETSGGDGHQINTPRFGSRVSRKSCGSRKSRGKSGNEMNHGFETNLSKNDQLPVDPGAVLSPKRKLFGWMYHAFKGTRDFLSKFLPRCGRKKEDVGREQQPAPEISLSDSMHLISENNGNFSKMIKTELGLQTAF